MQKPFLPRIWHIGALQYILRLFVDSDKEQKFVKVAELVLSDFSEIFAAINLINKPFIVFIAFRNG